MGAGILQKLGEAVQSLTPAHVNSIVDAMRGHFLPRNNDVNGAPSNKAHDLGLPNNQWRDINFSGQLRRDGQPVNLGGGGSFAGAIAPGISARLAGGYVSSGRLTDSGEPSFIVPAGASGIRLYSSAADPLVVVFKDGTSRTVAQTDDEGNAVDSKTYATPAHTRGSGAANTAQTNIHGFNATRHWEGRAIGYGGCRCPLLNVGSDWTEVEDEVFAFSPNENGNDMGICRVVDNGGIKYLTDAWRGFFGKKGAGVNDYAPGSIQAMAANVTLSYSNIIWVFYRKDDTLLAHPRNIYHCSTPLLFNPSGLVTGDIRLNVEAQQWEVYTAGEGDNPGTWAFFDAVLIGMAAPAANNAINFARGVYPDTELQKFAASPIMSGGDYIGGDDHKFRPNFSPHYREGTSGTDVDHRVDPLLDERDQVKYCQPVGAARLSPDWGVTQAYQFSAPIRPDARVDNTRGRRIEVDLDLPSSPADNDRLMFYIGNDLTAAPVKESLVPPIMVEAAGRQLFIHPHSSLSAFATAKRNGNEWDIKGIHRDGSVSVAVGDMYGIRHNADGGNVVFDFIEAGFSEIVGGGSVTARYKQRGRFVKLTKLGEWNTYVSGGSVLPNAAGEWDWDEGINGITINATPSVGDQVDHSGLLRNYSGFAFAFGNANVPSGNIVGVRTSLQHGNIAFQNSGYSPGAILKVWGVTYQE